MRHGVMYFPYNAQLSSSSGHAELQVEGETEEEVMLGVEKMLEQYYSQFFKGKPQEVMFGLCNDGEPIGMSRLGDKYSVRISVSIMLEPKREGSVKRRAKREEDHGA